jgi:hypothetical protein
VRVIDRGRFFILVCVGLVREVRDVLDVLLLLCLRLHDGQEFARDVY